MEVLKKVAAALALFIGVMSVFAGSKVLFGIDTKDYNVLTWLVTYNVIFGVISIVTGFLLWRKNHLGLLMMWFILATHFCVFIYINFLNGTAANESIMAMLFRVSMWMVIALLSFIIPKYFNKKSK